jgi:hypothetical protein
MAIGRKLGDLQGASKGRAAGAEAGAAAGRSAGKKRLAELQAAQARAAQSSVSSAANAGCPSGEVPSQNFNNPGQCIATGYSPGTGQDINGTPMPPTFVDPNGVECTAGLVVNGYCQAPWVPSIRRLCCATCRLPAIVSIAQGKPGLGCDLVNGLPKRIRGHSPVKRVVAIFGALLLIATAFGAAFAIGRSTRTTQQQARSAQALAYRAAYRRASRNAFERWARIGSQLGAQAGIAQAKRDGQKAGRRDGTHYVAQKLAAQLAGQAQLATSGSSAPSASSPAHFGVIGQVPGSVCHNDPNGMVQRVLSDGQCSPTPAPINEVGCQSAAVQDGEVPAGQPCITNSGSQSTTP